MSDEFDNIENKPAESNAVRSNNNSDGLQGLIRFLSIFPCFPSYVEKPDTPNIEEVNFVFIYTDFFNIKL
jgi:hypothetical protein